MTTNYENIKGQITIECRDSNGIVIDRYENHNLIMDAARVAMAKMTAGISSASEINKFVIGTQGHVGSNYLQPKTSADGFIGSLTKLFSETSAAYNYKISFDTPGTESGSCLVTSETDATSEPSKVSLVYTDKSVEYTIEIFENTANNTGTPVVFTEAALYAGSNIFSMKCFPGKIKDNTVSLKIIWKIMF